jgi:hypothetical protein
VALLFLSTTREEKNYCPYEAPNYGAIREAAPVGIPAERVEWSPSSSIPKLRMLTANRA